MALDTLFQNVTGGAAGVNQYVQDVLSDVTVPADSNSGLTDTAATNPLGQFVGNNDVPRFRVQTLWISSITKNDGTLDFASSVGLKPTYQLNFHRTQTEAKAYVFGNPRFFSLSERFSPLNRPVVVMSDVQDGCIVTGRFQRVNWIVESRGGTVETLVDGAGAATTTLDANVTGLNVTLSGIPENVYYTSIRNASSNSTDDLHTFQIRNTSAAAIRLVGIEIYYTETPASGPGSTYVNKNKNTTTVSTTFSLPSMGSSLGGIQAYVKNQASGVTLTAQGYTAIAANGLGSSGTNILNMTTGTGGSFPQNSILYASQGSSLFYAHVTNQSTDTLTVAPTLSFGVSNIITKFGQYGFSQTISASTYIENIKPTPFSSTYYWSGFTAVPTTGYTSLNTLFFQGGGSAQIGFEGNYNALGIAFGGSGIFHGTFIINGVAAFGVNQAFTNTSTRSVVIDLPNQWHIVQFLPGLSMSSSLPIYGFRMFDKVPVGISYGVLAYEKAQVAFMDRNASLGPVTQNIGSYQRVYANNMNFSGNWTPGATLTAPGNIFYYGSAGSTAVMNFHYYGNQLSVLGVQNGASFALTVDGGAVGATLNRTISPGSEGWHQVALVVRGGTLLVSGIEYARTFTEKTVTQSVAQDSQVSCIFSAGLTSGTAFGLNASIIYDAVLFDTMGIYNATTGYIRVPKSARYRFSVVSQASALHTIYLIINNVSRQTLHTLTLINSVASGSATVQLVAGDYVTVVTDANTTFGGISSGRYQNEYSVELLKE